MLLKLQKLQQFIVTIVKTIKNERHNIALRNDMILITLIYQNRHNLVNLLRKIF